MFTSSIDATYFSLCSWETYPYPSLKIICSKLRSPSWIFIFVFPNARLGGSLSSMMIVECGLSLMSRLSYDVAANSSCCKGIQKYELCSSLCMTSSFKFSSSQPTGGGWSSTSLGSSNDDFRSDICSYYVSDRKYTLSPLKTSPLFALIL